MPLELEGYGGDGAGVGGDVVAHRAVAPGEGLDQLAGLVGEGNGHAVVFQFAGVGERCVLKQFARAGLEVLDFLDAVGVAEGEHGETVGDLAESLVHLTAYAACG